MKILKVFDNNTLIIPYPKSIDVIRLTLYNINKHVLGQIIIRRYLQDYSSGTLVGGVIRTYANFSYFNDKCSWLYFIV